MKVTEPARILYVITKATWGGAQRYVYDLALAATSAGHTVRVATGTPGELTERLTAHGIDVVTIPAMQRDIDLWSEFRTFFALLRLMREFRPTVVHGNSSKAGGVTALAARVLFVPRIIFTAHGWAFNEDRSPLAKAIIWFLHYATVILSDLTICVSESMRRDAHGMPFVRGKFRVIPNGVEPSAPLSRADARFILAPHISFPTWIGTIAELHPTKQLSVLIRAFREIADEYPDATLIIMGEGEERVRLEELVRTLDLDARVRLRGHVESAAAYLPALDIFALPSRSEALGYVLLEAGLAGLPVVASNVGGIPEVIENEVTGLLVPSGDVDALAAALKRYLDDEELRSRMASALQARVANSYTKEEMIKDTLTAY